MAVQLALKIDVSLDPSMHNARLIANSPDWNMRSEMSMTSMCQAPFFAVKKSDWHRQTHGVTHGRRSEPLRNSKRFA